MSTDLAIPSKDFALMAFTPKQLEEVIADNLAGESLSISDLDVVKFPSGGGKSFSVPDITSGEIDVPTIIGFPIFWQATRAYWPESFDDKPGEPPLCRSNDGRHGEINEDHEFFLNGQVPEGIGGDCESCPMAQFESAEDGRRQACKAMRRVFIVQKDTLLPLMLVCPPTSIKPFKKFMTSLVSRAVPYWAVQAEFSLEVDKSQGGIKYSRLVIRALDVAQGEERELLKAHHEALKPFLMQIPVGEED